LVRCSFFPNANSVMGIKRSIVCVPCAYGWLEFFDHPR
jgi:hypothetical protein